MKLLMITRKVDPADASPAGFAYYWVRKLSRQLEKTYVITWQGSKNTHLPENTEVVSLPEGRLGKIISLQRHLFKILPEVDGVFCHQNPEYTILAAPLSGVFNKKIVSWYTHKAVNWKLHLVNWLADRILTASEESCRLKDRSKIEVVGHGIDTARFRAGHSRLRNSEFRIVSIGRISLTKDYQTLIRAGEILKNQNKEFKIEVIGQPVLEKDKEYFEELKQSVRDKGLENQIQFLGGISHNSILPYYQNSDLMINLSQTGSLDKAVLEAMACQCLVLTSNEAFRGVLKDKRLIFEPKNSQDLADKIIVLMGLSLEEKKEIGQRLREEVVKNHNLDKLVLRIIKAFK